MQKDSRPEFYGIGLLDIERSLTKEIAEKPWQTDTCLGQWFYDAQAEYKTFDQVIGLLVDIVAKNGNLLLNIPQRPDGTIDDDCRYVLEKLAAWFAVCGEAIYATRPYTVYGEGPNQVPVENRAEGRGMAWTPYDFRFTQREGTVYAFIMGSPRTVVLHRLENCVAIRRVRLLGAGEIPFSIEAGVLAVKLPDKMPLEFSNCLAIES
jgi:alpha-L-fucosidase